MSAVDTRDDAKPLVGSGVSREVGSSRHGSAHPFIALIRVYQTARSGRPTGCRYHPSCSEYAIEAVDRHGTVRGGWMTLRRISRCTPWGGHGFDPVPERSTP